MIRAGSYVNCEHIEGPLWGCYRMVCGNLVPWKNKKQVVVEKSSFDVEYHVMAHGCCKWLRILLELRRTKQGRPMTMHGENISAINIDKNPLYH